MIIRELAAPRRGCTHAVLQEVFFSLKDGLAYCRGVLGTMGEVEGEMDPAFRADPDLAPFYAQWEGDGFTALLGVLDSEPLIAALDSVGWGSQGG